MPRLSCGLRYEYDVYENPITMLDVLCWPAWGRETGSQYFMLIGFDNLFSEQTECWFLYTKLLRLNPRLEESIPEVEIVKIGLHSPLYRDVAFSIDELLTCTSEVVRKTAKKFIRKYPILKQRSCFLPIKWQPEN